MLITRRFRTKCSAAVLTLFFCFLSHPFSSSGAKTAPHARESWFDREFQKLTRSLQSETDPVRGANTLYQISNLQLVLDDPDRIEQTFENVAEDPARHPLLRSEALWLLADLQIARGKIAESASSIQRLGFVLDWLILGPFDNESKSGYSIRYAPEENPGFGETFQGKERKISWRRLAGHRADGFIDLQNAFYPTEGVLCYASTFVFSPETTKAAFRFGADDAVRIWLNGAEVYSNERYHQAHIDQDSAGVVLRKGWNLILVKVCQFEGDWGFYFRITRPDGSPLPELQILADPAKKAEVSESGGQDESAGERPDVEDLLEHARKQAEGGGAAAHHELARLYGFKRYRGDETFRPDVEEFEKVLALDPKNSEAWIELSRTYDEKEKKLSALEKSIAIRETPDAFYSQGTIYLDKDQDFSALRCFKKAMELDPSFYIAELKIARICDTKNLFAKARQIGERIRNEHPGASSVRRNLAEMYDRNGLHPLAAEEYREARKNNFTSASLREALLGVAFAMKNESLLMDLFDRQLSYDPTDIPTRIQKAHLLHEVGKTDEAFQEALKAREMAPQHPEIPVLLGEFYLQKGDKKTALKLWTDALALRPENPTLRERLEFHSGEEAFQNEFILNAAGVVEKFRSEEGKKATKTTEYLSDLQVRKVFANGMSHLFTQAILYVATEEEAKEFSMIPVDYDPGSQEVKLLMARIYRPDGTVQEGNEAGERQLSEPEFRVYYDYRERVIGFSGLRAGDILELQYRKNEIERDVEYGSYFGELVFFQKEYPIRSQEYILIAPEGMDLKYAGVKIHPEPVMEKRTGEVVYRWKEVSLPPLPSEPHMPGMGDTSPYLHISTFGEWKEMASWYKSLIRDQLESNRELTALSKTLASGSASEIETVKKIYGWVIKNTRYVALEFGIHGYKPYPVTQIFLRRFGDCKDKASLLVAMLREAGIESRLALVRTRDLGALKEHPPSLAVFNHVIVYVPKLSLWLDGTAEYTGSAELPFQDQGAMTLPIGGEAGGEIKTIPENSPEMNQSILTVEAVLSPEGELRFSYHDKKTGLGCPILRRSFQTKAKQKELVEKGFQEVFPGCKVKSAQLSDLTDFELPVERAAEGTIPNYATKEAGALRLPSMFTRYKFADEFAQLEERKMDIDLGYPRILKQEVSIELPQGSKVERLPENVHAESPFGTLDVEYKIEDRSLSVAAVLRQNVTRIRVSEYPETRKFFFKVDETFSRDIRILLPAGR